MENSNRVKKVERTSRLKNGLYSSTTYLPPKRKFNLSNLEDDEKRIINTDDKETFDDKFKKELKKD